MYCSYCYVQCCEKEEAEKFALQEYELRGEKLCVQLYTEALATASKKQPAIKDEAQGDTGAHCKHKLPHLPTNVLADIFPWMMF